MECVNTWDSPECTERSAASLCHDTNSIPRSYHRESTDDTIITRQDQTPTVKEIQRPAVKDHEVPGAVCWRPEDPEFLAKIMCSPECPDTVNCSHKTFLMFYIYYVSLCIFHYYIHVICYF